MGAEHQNILTIRVFGFAKTRPAAASFGYCGAQMVTRASQRTLGGGQQAPAEPQTALSKRDRDQTPDAQDSWSDAVEAKRRAEEAETQPTQPPDEARAPASLPKPKTV